MGAGSFAAGYGRAGLDPVYIAPPAAAIVTPRAMYYDPRTRQFKYNADGATIADVHPVDQRVALLLTIEAGSIRSAPTVGNRIRARIYRQDQRKVANIILDDVRRTLAPLIDAGDIVLVAVDVDASVPGRKMAAVTYINKRLQGAASTVPTTLRLVP